MDKKERQRLKKELKRKAWEKMANDPSVDGRFRNMARMELGQFDYQITLSDLHGWADAELEERIEEKIQGYLHHLRKANPREFSEDHLEVKQLSPELQMIYHTTSFESYAYMEEMADCLLENRQNWDLPALQTGYELLGFEPMRDLLETSMKTRTYAALRNLNQEYLRFEKQLKLHKVGFIRTHLNKFVL